MRALKRDDFRPLALAYSWRMIFSDLPSPAEASSQTTMSCQGFAQAGNRYPLFGIMRKKNSDRAEARPEPAGRLRGFGGHSPAQPQPFVATSVPGPDRVFCGEGGRVRGRAGCSI